MRAKPSSSRAMDVSTPARHTGPLTTECFLEYESETVKVHDIVYQRNQGKWKLNRSFYRKLRLSKAWVDEQLSNVGFNHIESKIENGLVTVIADKQNI